MAKGKVVEAKPIEIPVDNFDTVSNEYSSKPTVKNVQMHAGLDMIGSKTSVSSRTADIYEVPHGLKIVSKGTGRRVVVPFTNIRGYELL